MSFPSKLKSSKQTAYPRGHSQHGYKDEGSWVIDLRCMSSMLGPLGPKVLTTYECKRWKTSTAFFYFGESFASRDRL